MHEKKIEFNHPDGLDMKTIAHLIQKASEFESSIYIHVDEHRANAKSLLGVMSLPLTTCEELTIKAEGSDAEAAIESLAAYISEPTA
ncbi:MAG: HPr family phosphocarrier protein [Eubacteriales bacterium]|nr:HPr family phosphocarrier protein [Eubacteriales bacterium]